MKITIECESCGNQHTLSTPAKKYLQLRDNLEVGGYRYTATDTVIKDGKLKELMIHCNCGNWITLGVD